MRARALLAPTTTCIVFPEEYTPCWRTPQSRVGRRTSCRQIFPAEQVPVCPGPNKLSYRATGPRGRCAARGCGASGSSGCQVCRPSSRARLELRPILRKTYGRSAGYNPSQPNSTSARRKHELLTARAEVPPWCSSLCPRIGADDGILSKRTLCERILPGRVPSDRVPDDSVRAHRIFAWGCPSAPARRARRLVVCVWM